MLFAKQEIERFWSKVKPPIGIGECWEWQAALDGHGYGLFWLAKHQPAHRIAYQMLNGPIPEGKVIDHLCRNHRCVNPYHMEVVTHKVNLLRGIGWGGKNTRKTHCPRGHPLTEENCIRGVWRKGGRACQICMTEYQKNYREANKEKLAEYKHAYYLTHR